MKFSMKGFFSKCGQIRSFLRVWPHLLKKSLLKNFIFCAVFSLSIYFIKVFEKTISNGETENRFIHDGFFLVKFISNVFICEELQSWTKVFPHISPFPHVPCWRKSLAVMGCSRKASKSRIHYIEFRGREG